MKVTELRIGNWVTHQESFNQVYAIQFLDSQMNPYRLQLSNLRSKMGVSLLDVQPIPLTPEIFLHCMHMKQNFTSDPQEVHYAEQFTLGEFAIHHFTMGDEYFFYSYEGLHTKIKYLHELQNLVFATTHEELTVNL